MSFPKLAPVVVSAILAAAGCGAVKIKGLGGPGSSSSRSSAPAASSGPPTAATPTATSKTSAPAVPAGGKPAHVIRLAPGFANPTHVPGFVARTPMRSFNLGLDCDARYAEQPVAIVELARPTKKLQLTASGAGAVAIVFDGTGACGVSNYSNQPAVVMLDEWPAGKAAIYVGDTSQDRELKVALQFEELGRGVDVGWDKDDKIQRVKLGGLPDKPIVVHVAGGAPRKYASLGSGCSSASFRAQPDFVLEATAPLVGLELGVRSTEHSILVIGPVTADGRNIPQRCMQQRDEYGFGRLEPGIYGISLGGDEGPGPNYSNLVVTSSTTPAAPTALAPVVPAKLSLFERSIMVHFPQLGEELYKTDDTRFGVLAAAPRRLFVYVARDLDARSASLIGIGDNEFWPEGQAPARALPVQNEPVLLIGGSHILTMDGNLFAIDARDLAPAPSGEPRLPEAARNPEASFQFSKHVADASGAKLVKDYDASSEAYQACNMMIWNRVNRDIEKIQTGPWRPDNDQRVAAIQDKTRRKVIAQCKLDALEKKQRQTWAKLITLRTARRSRDLATVRDHFSAETP